MDGMFRTCHCLQAVAGIIISELAMENVHSVRAKKSQWIQLIARIHGIDILCSLINSCANVEAHPSVTMLHSIAHLQSTCIKLLSAVYLTDASNRGSCREFMFISARKPTRLCSSGF